MDNSRVEEVLNAVADNLGVRIDQLPAVGSAPEYFAEKAVSIAFWAVDLGIFTHVGDQPNIIASQEVTRLLTAGVEGLLGGKLYVQPDPVEAARRIGEVIEEKRRGLGLTT